MPLAKLSSKSQIVLPAKIRRKLDLHPGDTLEILEQGESVLLRKAPRSYLQELEGCISDLWIGYGRELKEARDEWER
ncbi:MAG: AbrB/MazE/SpoVT family DNA-binding domain-containing protein [Trichloromonadaceae bacterium]